MVTTRELREMESGDMVAFRIGEFEISIECEKMCDSRKKAYNLLIKERGCCVHESVVEFDYAEVVVETIFDVCKANGWKDVLHKTVMLYKTMRGMKLGEMA